MKNVIAAELLSRDPVVQKEFVEDELCHDTGTLEGLAGMLDRAGALEKGDVVVREGAGEGGKTRIWISHGTKDEVCDFEATKKLYEKLEVEDKECKWYDGWYHKRKLFIFLSFFPFSSEGEYAQSRARDADFVHLPGLKS